MGPGARVEAGGGVGSLLLGGVGVQEGVEEGVAWQLVGEGGGLGWGLRWGVAGVMAEGGCGAAG